MSPILLLFVHNYRQPNCIQFLYIVFRENATHGIARLMAHSEKKEARWERERENAKRIRSHRPFQRNIAGAKNSLCMEMCVGSFTLFRKSPSSKIISFCSNIFGIIKKSKAPYRLLKSAVHTCASQSTFAYLSTICAFFVVFVGRQNMLKQNNFAARIIKTKKKIQPISRCYPTLLCEYCGTRTVANRKFRAWVWVWRTYMHRRCQSETL